MLLNPGTFTDTNGTWTGGLASYNGSNAQHVAFATKYDILPTASDPLYTFNVNTPEELARVLETEPEHSFERAARSGRGGFRAHPPTGR